jgi:hypothetical protein
METFVSDENNEYVIYTNKQLENFNKKNVILKQVNIEN